ncbi:MAG: EamA family transporter, partial [Zestosphaera sp.]
MLGGHTVINYLLKRMKSYVVTSIALGEPPGATLLAALILGQQIQAETILGMALALVGILITVYGSLEKL